ncbi:MAG: 3-mercaptopyruvate sulfurtransferase [Hyphomicrobiales bacterium]|nr:3-mercaptopyruvate sulfurtransferase [Hyphomicrobiales bacterium]
MARDDVFVSTDWLERHLGRSDVVVVDGSYYLSTMNRNGAEEFLVSHIPGAVGFDIDAVKDKTSPLPHMLPTAAEFAATVGAMGISDDMTIIVYDGAGLFAAPRVRWTFRSFGAKRVFILDGGFPQWLAEARAVEAGPPKTRPPRTFNAVLDPAAVASLADVKDALSGHTAQVLDARPANRFSGEAPEPRPNLPSGHMPGSINLPYGAIIENGRLKDDAALAAAFAAAGVDLDKPVITSCGSGVTAAILSTAMEIVGKPAKALYDGSWAEYGSCPDAVIVAGKG